MTKTDKVFDLYFNKKLTRKQIRDRGYNAGTLQSVIKKGIKKGLADPYPFKPNRVPVFISDEIRQKVMALYNPPSYLAPLYIAEQLAIPYSHVTQVVRESKKK